MEIEISILEKYLDQYPEFIQGYLARVNRVHKKKNPFDPWNQYQNWVSWQTGWYQSLEDCS